MNEKTNPVQTGTQGSHDDKNKTATMTPPVNQPEKPSAAQSATPEVKPAAKV